MKTLVSKEKLIEVIRDTKKDTVGFLVFSLIMVTILLVGAVRPTVSTIFRIIAEIAEKESVVIQLDEKILALSSLQREYNETVRSQVNDLSLIFPAKGDLSLIMANFEKVCEKYSFELTNITFDAVDMQMMDDQNFEVLAPTTVVLSLTGFKADIIKLLRAIEALPMYPVVETVSYSGTDTDDGTTGVTVRVKIYKVNDPTFYGR